MANARRYDVLVGVRDVIAGTITPAVQIGFPVLTAIHTYPHFFVTLGPGSVTSKITHARQWDYRLITRIIWVIQGSDAEPVEKAGLDMYERLFDVFESIPRPLIALVKRYEPIGDLGTEEGMINAATGSRIAPFWQDYEAWVF